MTESNMESNRGVQSDPSTSQQPQQQKGASLAKKQLNPTAKSFVFSVAAPAWTPPASFAPAAPVAAVAAPVAVPVVVAPVPAPVVAAAPLTPVKPTALKPSAREFVPSVYAPAFVPTFTVAPPPPAPPLPCVAAPPASPVKAAVAPPAVVVDKAPVPASTVVVEPESEDISEATAEPVVAAVVAAVVTPEAEEAEAVETPKEQVVASTEEAKKEATKDDATTEEDQQTAALGDRIMYTIAQLLEMEPETTPMPASVVGTQVSADKKHQDDHENDHATSPHKNGGGRGGGKDSSRRGGGGGGDSSRSLHRSNSSYSDNGRGGRGGRGGGGRGGGGRGGRGGYPPQPEISLEDCVPLQVNEETRWKPAHAKSKLTASTEELIDPSTTEISLKEAKSILNKLSIEKFDKLSDQLIDVAVRTMDVLSGVIDMVITKAQQEWHFSTMYASLCFKIAQTEMPAMAMDANEVAQDTHKLFRKLLLTRCQKEFEITPSKEGWEELPEDERAEKELLLKRATLGHIRFVGELFKQGMLSSRIMHACVQRLFGDISQPDEESLECMCKLLATIGYKIENDARDQNELNLILQYYGAIKQLAGDAAKLSTRVRFMLQDLLDLRKNKWVARRKETKAMTIAEVHAEAAKEAKDKAKASAAASNGSGSGSSRGLHRSSSMSSGAPSPDKRRGGGKEGGGASAAWKARAANGGPPASAPSGGSSVDADGWETVNAGARPKLAKSRSTVATSSPGSAPPRHATLSRNSSDGSATTRNSFASLSSSSSNGNGNGRRDSRDRSFSASSSPGFGGRRSSPRDNANTNNSVDRPPRHLTNTNTNGSSPQKPTNQTPTQKSENDGGALAPDEFKKKIKAIFDEYVELQDLDEAVTCIKELNSSAHHALIIQQTMDIGLEKANKQRTAVGSLLVGLFDNQLLDKEAFSASVFEQLEFAEDMEIDIPLTLTYLAQMLAPSVARGAVTPARLVESVQHMKANGKAAKFMALLLSSVGDEEKAKELANEVDLKELLREEERNDEGLRALYTQHNLAFLLPEADV